MMFFYSHTSPTAAEAAATLLPWRKGRSGRGRRVRYHQGSYFLLILILIPFTCRTLFAWHNKARPSPPCRRQWRVGGGPKGNNNNNNNDTHSGDSQPGRIIISDHNPSQQWATRDVSEYTPKLLRGRWSNSNEETLMPHPLASPPSVVLPLILSVLSPFSHTHLPLKIIILFVEHILEEIYHVCFQESQEVGLYNK